MTGTVFLPAMATEFTLLQGLFREQRANVDYFFQHMDMGVATELLRRMENCEGIIFLTGVGKSAMVAQKIAATLVSTGTRALYLSAVDGMHGDLGIVQDKDMLIAFSKSGESDELLTLLPHVRNKGVATVAVTSNPSSRLARGCELHVELPLQRELCPFDLAPTTSAALQMLFGDILVVALMQRKQFSLDDYAGNHPAGRIGKRITVKVEEVMVKGEALPLCAPEDSLGEVLCDVTAKRCGCMLVVDSVGTLLGIFTDGDLRRALQTEAGDLLKQPMGTLMTKQARTIAPEALAYEALKRMEEDPERRVYMLPVTRGKKAVGLIRMHDILQHGL